MYHNFCCLRGLPFIFRDYRTKTNINHRKSIYCVSKYSSLRSIHFCMRLNQLSKHFCHSDEVSPKHVFWTHQSLLQVSKNVDLSFYFLRMGIKRSHSVPSQDFTADDSSNRCFECSKMQLLFEPMCEEWSVFGG